MSLNVRLTPFLPPLLLLTACAPDPRISAVENELPAVSVGETTVRLSLREWMDTLGVPGISIAVIDDYRIAWARGYGTLEAGDSSAPVSTGTLFQGASIAKAVTAAAVMRQVQDGTLDLNADVSASLRSWSVPAEDSAVKPVVSLRQLLSHTAGIKPGGFVGYERGTPLPTTLQVLNGEEPALNTRATLQAPPGAAVAYSGLGYTIVELVLVEKLGAQFDMILDASVFRPFGMSSSLVGLEPAASAAGHVARGHFAPGAVIPGGWRLHPELAAAGLWTTPTDLARLAIGVANGWTGRFASPLTAASARLMLTPVLDRSGLAFTLRLDDTLGFFSHSGGNEGYRAHLEMLAGVGKGVVVMTNSDNGHPLAALITLAVARAWSWPDSAQRRLSPTNAELLLSQMTRVREAPVRVPIEPDLLVRYTGHYELAPGLVFDIKADPGQGRLLVRLGDQSRLPAYPASDLEFFFEAVDARIAFTAGADGRVTGLQLRQGGRTQEARRLD